METKFIISKDNSKIAYKITGKGPALLLVHGGIGNYNKKLWYDLKWVDILKTHFTIITPDIRGNGESDNSHQSCFYHINNIIDDFNLILNDCKIEEFYYFGWSYGATIGFHMCKKNTNIIKAICAGSILGPQFSKEFAPNIKKHYEYIKLMKETNRLDELKTTNEEKKWIKQTDLDTRIALFKSWETWPVILPSDIKTKMAIYTGTNDYQDLVKEINKFEKELTDNKINVKVFDDLDHFGLIKEIDIIIPWVLDFFTKEQI